MWRPHEVTGYWTVTGAWKTVGTSEAIRKMLEDYDILAFFRIYNTLQDKSTNIRGLLSTQAHTGCVFRSLVGIVLPNTVDKYPDSQRSQSRDTK